MKDIPWMSKTWFEVDRAVERLAARLKPLVESGKISQIYAIPKGGLPMGVELSHQLGEIPMIFREDQITDDTVIFDEIIHRGVTMMRLLVNVAGRGGKPTTVSYLRREGSLYRPDYYDEEVDDARVVKLPWETEESAWKSYMRSQAG